jgi:hypothetical protein
MRLDAKAGRDRDVAVGKIQLATVRVYQERHPEARAEIQRAIECKRAFGHVAEPWKTWTIRYRLEEAAGDAEAAAQARRQAIAAYRAYRRDGGEPKHYGGQLCDQAAQAIAQLAAEPDNPAYLQALIPKLQAILEGARDPALADNDAAELALLLERLGQA